MTPYILTKDAEADLREIIRYSRKHWGTKKARQYIDQVIACIRRMAEIPEAHLSVEHLYPGLRLAHCSHYYVFCLPQKNEPPLIVAIFHERMALMARLKNRLPDP